MTWTRWKRLAGAAFALLGILNVLYGFHLIARQNRLRREMQFTIPTPVMPSPNAFDTLMAATAKLNSPQTVAAAHRSLGATGQPPRGARALMGHNRGALSLIERALGQRYLSPPLRHFTQDLSYKRGFRNLACLLALEAADEGSRGRWSACAQTALDGVALGRIMPEGASIAGAAVAESIQEICRE